MTPLQSAALASIGWAIGGLAWTSARAWARSTPAATAAPAGEAWRGILYAFGQGMSPRAKESARRHPVVYAVGVTYHAGVFSAVATLGIVIFAVRVSPWTATALAAFVFAGFLAGAALLIRRVAMPLLRTISAPDDYAANLIVDAWLFTAAVAWLQPATRSPFLVASILLGLYAPLGKIRHCVFFFLSRGLYGARLGRRGIVHAARAGVAR